MKRSASPAVFPGPPALLGVAAALPIGRSPIVAHQGGWDEILLVVAPLAVIGGLLWLANRRVTAQLQEEDVEGSAEAAAEMRAGDDVQD